MTTPDGRPYLPASTAECPTFVENTEWRPFVDGAAYLSELDGLLSRLTRGDAVLIAGFEFEPTLDLAGRNPDDGDYDPLGRRLARLAADGVDVRILLAGKLIARVVPIPSLAGFRRNIEVARLLQKFRPDGAPDGPAPLAGRVLVDYTAPLLGSHHQKVVVIRHGPELTAYVGGIDLTTDRFDCGPHDTFRRDGQRWGWHDLAVRLRGPAAERVHAAVSQRWARVRPRHPADRPAVPPSQPACASPGTSVRVLRSLPPHRRVGWKPRDPAVHEVFETLSTALQAAHRYIYIEDQYLDEQAGGTKAFELFPYLRGAAARGVKIVLVGSGVRDPDDPGLHLTPINRRINRDVRKKLLGRLDRAHRDNVAVFRVEQVTVHAKLFLIDDRFACIGSANMFSRSMSGTDSELSAAVSTTTDLVRNLRVQVWAEHLRTAVSDQLRPYLENVDISLGIWRSSWSTAPDGYWRSPHHPLGFEPIERALSEVPARRRRRARG